MSPSADIQHRRRAGDVGHRRHVSRRASRSRRSRRVERETGQMFARISCKPLAGVDRSEHAARAGGSRRRMPPRPEEPAEAERREEGLRQGAATRRSTRPARRDAGRHDGAPEHRSPSSTAGPEEILRPVQPWFILLTLLARAAREPACRCQRRRAGAAARLPRAGAAVLVHPGAALRRRRHRVGRRAADGRRRRDGVRPARARVRGARLRAPSISAGACCAFRCGSRRRRWPCCSCCAR